MLNQFSRTELLFGKSAMEILNKSRIAVFGIGGVGGFSVEALVRSGIAHIDIIDNDEISLTNLNRQIIATRSSIGRAKVDVMKERILDINPNAEVNTFKCFYLPETSSLFDFRKYDYVIDALDTVTAKIHLILQAKEAGTRIISSMGTGNKTNPLMFEVADISETSVCPLARVMRQECKKRGIKNVKIVYSKEKPQIPPFCDDDEIFIERKGNGTAPGSCSFVPSVAGLIIAGEVIKDLIKSAQNKNQKI